MKDASIASGDELRVLATPMADGKQHTDMEIAHRWFDFLKEHTDYDQLILETKNGLDYWIHVSCRKNREKNRHQVFVN